jgi:D-amino peptidase
MQRTLDSLPFRHILILADIEGSSGCGSYRASSFLTRSWAQACVAMSLDVNAVVKGLFDAGVRQVTVKDFHRTGYNLLPELIDHRARIVCGYRRGLVPGLGNPGNADALMMIGMHAASGTTGFLPHTLTSRFAALVVNGRPMAEMELFSASLAPFEIPPVFFSGCPVACSQARERIPGIRTFPIDKSIPPEALDADQWRSDMARAAAESLASISAVPYCPDGPFSAVIIIRDGAVAADRMAGPWGFKRSGATVVIQEPDIHALYRSLVRLCYLPPAVEKSLPYSLYLYHLVGRFGRLWVRRQLKAGCRH